MITFDLNLLHAWNSVTHPFGAADFDPAIGAFMTPICAPIRGVHDSNLRADPGLHEVTLWKWAFWGVQAANPALPPTRPPFVPQNA